VVCWRKRWKKLNKEGAHGVTFSLHSLTTTECANAVLMSESILLRSICYGVVREERGVAYGGDTGYLLCFFNFSYLHTIPFIRSAPSSGNGQG
jgi:hypothetical protein